MTERQETVFTYAAPGLRFGPGASAEIGYDLARLGARRVLLVTDPGVAAAGHPATIAAALRAGGLDPAAPGGSWPGVEVVVYDQAHVEPTDVSLEHAISFARDAGPFDAVVAVGGGSAIDTAKAVNLLTTNEGDLFDYLNAPIGRARAPQQPLLPLIAVPTTTGTGSESTTICVLDVLSLHVKTGISHVALRPTLAVVDPLLTLSQPPLVTASSGLDIACHALESYTARPYTDYPAKTAAARVPYCGANPVADLWAERSLELLGASLRRSVDHGDDAEAREQVALAATFAGLGFGNAGVHLPHAGAYPVAGRVKDYRPSDYPQAEPMVPHGMAVSLTAPEAFARTYAASPERHDRAAQLLTGTGVSGPDALPDALRDLMRDVSMPAGLAEVGYTSDDIPGLVEGAAQQQRLLATAPIEVTHDLLAEIFAASLHNW